MNREGTESRGLLGAELTAPVVQGQTGLNIDQAGAFALDGLDTPPFGASFEIGLDVNVILSNQCCFSLSC
jgi:hypothetical protein